MFRAFQPEHDLFLCMNWSLWRYNAATRDVYRQNRVSKKAWPRLMVDRLGFEFSYNGWRQNATSPPIWMWDRQSYIPRIFAMYVYNLSYLWGHVAVTGWIFCLTIFQFQLLSMTPKWSRNSPVLISRVGKSVNLLRKTRLGIVLYTSSFFCMYFFQSIYKTPASHITITWRSFLDKPLELAVDYLVRGSIKSNRISINSSI